MKTNSVIELIHTRRSIRKFTEEPVSREDLETIVDCGQWAPSGMNRQLWCFVVVQDTARIASLAQTLSAAIAWEGYDMYKPQALILVGHQVDGPYSAEDDGCAMQTMMLAAASLGLGSVWLNQFNGNCDIPEVRAALTELGLPQDYLVHGALALGHPAQNPEPTRRKSSVVWA